MGIYDSTGKLVRTLHREADVQSNAFFKEINGLVTFWNGKDDSGNPVPAGKYSARGFTVGNLQIEGEAFLCNDWASEDNSPRIRRITKLGALTDSVNLGVELVDGKPAQARCASSGTLSLDGAEVGGQMPEVSKTLKTAETPLASSPGREGSTWVIDRATDGAIEVKQFSQAGEFLRRLSIDPTQPLPKQIAASKTSDAICLLEENAQCQRFRWLQLAQAQPAAADQPTAQPVSTWTEVLSKTIIFNDRFEQVQSILKLPGGKPVVAQTKLSVSLVANPLLQDKVTNLEISLGFDASGSFIKSAGGLVLKRITDTPFLKWAVISQDPESKALVVFQSDGAVVEEYRIGAIANIMAFEYGEFTLKAP